jgi:threonine/homoserine/homoserine lactone efflux protein
MNLAALPELRALLAGVVAGLAVALPLGAISVLLLQEALIRGWRSAAAAATGVAVVDLGYATLATAAGTAVTRALDGRTRVIQVVGAAVLVVVAVRGLLGLRTSSLVTRPAGSSDTPSDTKRGTQSPAAAFRRFVAMTAINPLTAVYFAVLAAGLGTAVAGWPAGSAFVVGVFAGSWAWQLALVGLGSLAGARLPAWARTVTGLVGYLTVIGYAAKLASG